MNEVDEKMMQAQSQAEHYETAFERDVVPKPSTISEISKGCRISLREQIEGRFHQMQQAANESNKLRLLRRMIDQQPETFALISLMRDLNLL